MERYEEVLIALRRIIRAIDLHSRQMMQIVGLSGPQLLILKTIAQRGESTVGHLASSVHISHGTATVILDRLEKKGMVLRTRSDKDKRKVLVSLTQAGLDAVARAPEGLQDHFTEAFKGLQGWEQAQILASLERVAQMMDAQAIDAAPVLATQAIEQQ